MSTTDTATNPTPTPPTMTAPTSTTINGITINPPADLPYREDFMRHYGNLREGYPLEAWEPLMWQALWLMPEARLEAIARTSDGITEQLGDDWHYEIHEEEGSSDLDAVDRFMNFAALVRISQRRGDVNPDGTEGQPYPGPYTTLTGQEVEA